MTTTKFSPKDVKHIAKLANIPITATEEEKLAAGFNSVMQVIEQLHQVDVSKVEPTHQVTGLSNVFREDEVDNKRMFTQDEALANAKRKHHGYFVVDQILEQE